jgi:hypothetical protein
MLQDDRNSDALTNVEESALLIQPAACVPSSAIALTMT